MIDTIILDDMNRRVETGKSLANSIHKPILVSSTSRVDSMDPLAFFAQSEEKYIGSRFFWTDAERNVTLVGLGRILQIEPTNVEKRFEEVGEAWDEILAQAIMTEDVPDHTGPLLFGGFSFDPLKPRTKLWEHFPHTLFVVPQFMLTVTSEQTWLTINRLISPFADSDHSMENNIPQQLFSSVYKRETGENRVFKEEIERNAWLDAVEKSVQSIRAGELEKVVLSRELRLYAERPFKAVEALERLLQEQQGCTVFAFEQEQDCFVGASPERLVKREGTQFLTVCLAGSIARGETEAEDVALGEQLLLDHKNLNEHDLAVQLIEATMRAVCTDVQIPTAPRLHQLKDIQHLFTPISGQAKQGVSLLHVVGSMHPTPALGGYPQQKSVEMIREIERLDRGWFASPIGWMNRHQEGEFVVAIRSGLLQGKEASLFAGCGIVDDTDLMSEYEETKWKFQPMLSALNAID